MATTSNLPRTEYSGLNFDNLIIDLKNKIKENPDYNQNWDDFLSANAGRMLLELISYIIEQLGIRMDIIVNEFFLPTAQQDDSIINLIKLVSYQPQLANSAKVDVKCTVDTIYTKNIQMPYPMTLSIKNLNGDVTRFELIKKASGGKYEYPYDTNLTGHITEFSVANYNPKIDTLSFYEGTTFSQTYTALGIENELIYLNERSIVKDSIRLYKKNTDIYGTVTYKEATEVDSFLDPITQEKETFLPYKLELLSDGTYGIRFSDKTLMVSREEYAVISSDTDFSDWEDKLPIENDEYNIWYRTGGSYAGNVAPRSVNETKTFYDESNATTITMAMLNTKSGSGGSDAETLDQAKVNAPEFIASVDKAVTAQDNQILTDIIPLSLKSAHFGQQNLPNSLYELYGYDLLPVEVWHYIVPNVAGWETKKTWEYPETFRFTSKETMYMNDEMIFSTGKKNIAASLGISKTSEDPNNSTGSETMEQTIGDWNAATGDFAIDAGKFKFTFATGVGGISVNNGHLGTIEEDSLYKFVYTISGSTITGATAVIRNNFAFCLDNTLVPTPTSSSVELDLTNGTHTLYFRTTGTSPFTENFYIDVTGATSGEFIIAVTNMSLKRYKNMYRKTAILDERSSRDFIDFSSGTPTLFSIGSNDCVASNYEGNEASWEEINIKITKSQTSLNKFTRNGSSPANYIETQYSYKNEAYDDATWDSTDNGTFTLDIIDDKFLQIQIQDESFSSEPSDLYLHFVKPEGYYYEETGVNPYRYVYLNDYPLYPNQFEDEYEIKLTQNKNDERDLILTTATFVEDTDYIVESSIRDEWYKISTKGLDENTLISDFIPFYAHYKADKTGNNIELYTNANITNNLARFTDFDDFSIKFTVKVGDKEIEQTFSNLKFYSTIKSGNVNFLNTTTTLIYDPSNNFYSTYVGLYARMKDGPLGPTPPSTPATINKISNVSLEHTTHGHSLYFSDIWSPDKFDIIGYNYEIVQAPTGQTIADVFNAKFREITNDEIIRNYLYAYYDTEVDQLAFILREVPFLENNLDNTVSLTISDADSGTPLSGTNYLHFINNTVVNNDENQDGVSDVYGETHEFTINSELEDSRMTSHEYVYKQPIFKTFDIWLNVYYFSKFNPTSLENDIKTTIRENYNLTAVDFGDDVHRSKISELIYSINGVDRLSVEYFGLDQEDRTTDESEVIEAEFDELLIISDDEYEDNFPETKDYQIHGIHINMIKVV